VLQSSPSPKLNLLVTARGFADEDGKGGWTLVGGASNGVGQGQVLISVDPAIFRNGMNNGKKRRLIEDWWGLISAHEIGHALGRGGHTPDKFDTMCFAPPPGYGQDEIGLVLSKQFALTQASLDLIELTSLGTADAYQDPYAQTPKPSTKEKWSFPQIHGLLKRYQPTAAIAWVKGHKDCRNAAEDNSEIQCRNLKAYEACLASFPHSPKCARIPPGKPLTEPCCMLHGGW
jgi:hypothetical protein